MSNLAGLLDAALRRMETIFRRDRPNEKLDTDLFELHLKGFDGLLRGRKNLLSKLELPDGLYFAVIDIGAVPTDNGSYAFFVRPSGHEPRPFDETFDPNDLGPFTIVGIAQR